MSVDASEQWKRPVDEELGLINQLLREGFLSGAGQGLPKKFEEQFREFVGAKYCLTSCSGTLALMSAYFAVGVGPGDEVITPAWGYECSYAGALHLGARPVFCEVDPRNMLIDPKDAERRITERTRAINVVHMGGNVCDMDGFLEIGRRYGIAIVEDAAHACGAEWDGKKIGSVGDITCFSLQGATPMAKPVAGGEGGIVTTNNQELYERQLIYCHLHRFNFEQELTNPAYRAMDGEGLGLKFRAHPLALAIAKVSLDNLDYRIRKSAENQEKIFSTLRKLPGLKPEYSYPKAKRISLYGGLKVIYHPEQLKGLPCQKFVEAVKAEGIPVIKGPRSTQKLEYFKPLFAYGFDLWQHNRGPLKGEFFGLPPYKGYRRGDFRITENVSENYFTLPCYIEPKDGLLDQIIEGFQKITENYEALL